MSRPELQQPPELFYNDTEARKYNSSSRMVGIQAEISNRCIELLNLPADTPGFILDVGCGSGLSGEALEEAGHVWVGLDISRDMLDVANERETDMGDLCHHDMGTGLPFRPSTFDGCISVSALQWLCYAQTSEQSAKARLMRFFSSLYVVLRRGSRAALQFYPENPEQAVLISSCAAQAGFTGGLVVDYPNSAKAKKYYLCLSFEHSYRAPRALETDEAAAAASHVSVTQRERGARRGKKPAREGIKSRDWVMQKKERQRKQGKDTRQDTKYTGRKRKDKF
jgi:18S rRNA (guanine1575-N7)-methyltransferase